MNQSFIKSTVAAALIYKVEPVEKSGGSVAEWLERRI